MAVIFKKRGSSNILTEQISKYACGESIFLNVNNIFEEFIIIRQVNPDSKYYDETFNGTWIMKKTPINNISFYDIDNYLNNTFLNSLDINLIDNIKQVNLPAGNSVYPSKCFILSAAERDETFTADGSKIYANFPISSSEWTRTLINDDTVIILYNNQLIQTSDLNQNLDIHPVFILSYNTPFLKENKKFAGGINI